MGIGQKKFWQGKKLSQMTHSEWELLCDGCARCCLHKLEDEDTAEILFTRIACRLLDLQSCRCTRYADRCRLVEGCIDLSSDFNQFNWLPSTCAYRLLAEDKSLPDWHPLICGDDRLMRNAGMTVSGFAIPETHSIEPVDHVIEWLV